MVSGIFLMISLCYLPFICALFVPQLEILRRPLYLWFPCILHGLALYWIGFAENLWASPNFGLGVLSYIMFIGFQLLRNNKKMEALGSIHLPLGALLLLLAGIIPDTTINQNESSWILIHIILILIGFGCFALAFAQSLLFLFVRHRLKSKNLRGIVFFPSLERLDRLNHIGSIVGFVALSAGVAAGWFWSNGLNEWRWDIGSISSLSLWLLYAISIHARLIFGRRMHWTAWFSVVGFFVMCLVISIASLVGGWHLGAP